MLQFINDINTEITSLQMQMEEITRRNQIPREEGEPDLIRMKDTARAIPSTPTTVIPEQVSSKLFQKR